MAADGTTFSPADVAARWGCGLSYVDGLRKLGESCGQGLHPSRGGLWASFRLHAHARRYRLEALQAHESHMAKLERDPVFVARQLERARKLGDPAAVDQLIRRLEQMAAKTGAAA